MTIQNGIETDTFCISGSKFSRMLMLHHFRKIWWAYALPIVACGVMAFTDMRFLLVALMVIFIVLPMVLLFVYIVYGFDPVNRYNVMRKKIRTDADGLILEMDKDYGMKTGTIPIPWSSVKGRSVRSSCLLVEIDSAHYRFIAVPFDAFGNVRQLQSFIDMLDANVK